MIYNYIYHIQCIYRCQYVKSIYLKINTLFNKANAKKR